MKARLSQVHTSPNALGTAELYHLDVARGANLRMPPVSIDGDLGLQEDVPGGVAHHDLVGAGDDLPAVAEDVPVGEGAFVQG